MTHNKMDYSFDFIENMVQFIDESIHLFESNARFQIEIYMPIHLQRCWIEHVRRLQKDFNPKFGELKYRGHKVINNYQNTVVVGFTEILTTDFKPQTLQIP